MYLRTKTFPEFVGKDKKYRAECLTYCIQKTGYTRRFILAIAILLIFTVSWGILDGVFERNVAGSYEYYIYAAIGIVFEGYMLVEINTSLHPAVKRYITEFDQTKEDTGTIAA